MSSKIKTGRKTKTTRKVKDLLESIWPELPDCRIFPSQPDESDLKKAHHVLIVFSPESKGKTPLAGLPGRDLLLAVLSRKGLEPSGLTKAAVQVVTPSGALWSYLALADDAEAKPFERHVALREALKPLLDEKPKSLIVVLQGEKAWREAVFPDVAYTALVNSKPLRPLLQKTENKDDANAETSLESLSIYGASKYHEREWVYAQSLTVGNYLARRLSVLPANILSPIVYKEFLVGLAKKMSWEYEVFDCEKLKELGAGAFLAVAQGSGNDEASIVHLAYRPGPPDGSSQSLDRKSISLVGKGVCFDSGGLGLKPPRYMSGMHEDMNGSSVAVGILTAATRLELPVAIDVWLAIAENDLSPAAYRPGDIVQALNNDRIEIVHTDAEGRLLLADTLTLAVSQKSPPDLVIDFATLTGSMVTALGSRYSGVFASNAELAAQAIEAGRESGERVCVFPSDADYAEALKTPAADVKQCTMEGEGDHILAACFLSRFIGDRSWLHIDLSASSCKGGLGAVATETTGFGVAWGLSFLQRYTSRHESRENHRVLS